MTEQEQISEHDFNIAASLDMQLMVRQSWCTCKNPYWCNGAELEKIPERKGKDCHDVVGR